MSKIEVLNYHACLEQIDVYHKAIAKGSVDDKTVASTKKAVCHLQGLLDDLNERLKNEDREDVDIKKIHERLCLRLLKNLLCKCTGPPSCDIPDCPLPEI